jgi:uncharacterized protein (TIGR03435 family)
MAFDVASVKRDTADMNKETIHSNIPLGPEDVFNSTGGLLSSTNYPVIGYMIFAYKLTPGQVQSVVSQAPKWANTDRYDIEARASGNPTKDQFRLMMQALLADRFKLAIHYETKEVPVYALVLDKAGKFGSGFQQHLSDSPCSTEVPTTPGGTKATVGGGFPEPCDALMVLPTSSSGRIRLGARNVPLAYFAICFTAPVMHVDRPVLDKTGLTGKYDFVLEFTPEIPAGANFQPDQKGPTLLEAMKEQLGLKLESQTGPVDSIVVDHIEEPSVN